ncbi:uncharacterized protein LOC144169489 isoform X1 [Haemaphysalis longicornis]
MKLVGLLAFLAVISLTVDGAPVASRPEAADGGEFPQLWWQQRRRAEQELGFGELLPDDIEHLQPVDLAGDPCGDGIMSGPCLAIPWRPGSVVIRRPPQPPRRPRPGLITIG